MKYLIVTAAALVVSPLLAQVSGPAARVDSLEARIDSLSVVHDSLARIRAGMLVRSSNLSARIDRLRGAPGQTPGPLDKYRLNSALAASQNLADSLDLINWKLDDMEQEIDGLRLDAVAACTDALDSLSLRMKNSQAAPNSILARQFDEMRERRQHLAAVAEGEQVRNRRKDTARISLKTLTGLMKIEPGDSPEEIAEKSAFLYDVELRWKRALAALERNIGLLDEEREMRSRLGEFTQELALFDETGPSSRTRTVSNEAGGGDQATESLQPPRQGLLDFKQSGITTDQMAESIAYDIELADPEIELRLMQSMDRFSSGDIVDLVRLLRARRDSLALDLDSLKIFHEQLKKNAGLD